MARLSYRVEECGICFDNFEWITLEEDDEFDQILRALQESSLEDNNNKPPCTSPISVSYPSSSSSSRPQVSSSPSSTTSMSSTSTSSSTSSSTFTSTSSSSSSVQSSRSSTSVHDKSIEHAGTSSNPTSPKSSHKFSWTITSFFQRRVLRRQPDPLVPSAKATLDPNVQLSLGSSMPCNQKHLYCFSCLGTYMESQLKSKIWPIQCPEEKCKDTIPYYIVESVLGPKAQRWHELGVEHAIKKQVYCPNKKCTKLMDGDALGVSDQGGSSWEVSATCPYCYELFCALCLNGAHKGKTCKQVKHESSDDYLFENLAAKSAWKKCPGCGHMVEKISGCNHMTCRCKRQFCYVCPGDKWPCSHSHR